VAFNCFPDFLLDSASDVVGRLSMLYLEFDEKSPPPSIVSWEVISVTNTSVEVKAMRGSSYLLCGSYLASAFPSSSSSSQELSFGRTPVATLSLSLHSLPTP
jgi:hypothetical protein